MIAPRPIQTAIEVVAASRGITLEELIGQARTRAFAWARQEVCWIAREEGLGSYPQIGARLGGLDHTTVLYGERRVAQRMAASVDYAREMRAMRDAVAERLAEPAVIGPIPDRDPRDLALRILASPSPALIVSEADLKALARATLGFRDTSEPNPEEESA
jgi:hypothetical protein